MTGWWGWWMGSCKRGLKEGSWYNTVFVCGMKKGWRPLVYNNDAINQLWEGTLKCWEYALTSFPKRTVAIPFGGKFPVVLKHKPPVWKAKRKYMRWKLVILYIDTHFHKGLGLLIKQKPLCFPLAHQKKNSLHPPFCLLHIHVTSLTKAGLMMFAEPGARLPCLYSSSGRAQKLLGRLILH